MGNQLPADWPSSWHLDIPDAVAYDTGSFSHLEALEEASSGGNPVGINGAVSNRGNGGDSAKRKEKNRLA